MSDKLKENIAGYSKIFRLKQSNGFNIKQDRLFTGYQVSDKVPLIRSSTTPILQPGRKGGAPNYKGGIELANREGVLRPFQANLKLDEKTLYARTKQYLAKKNPADSSDIYSFEAMNWYMENVINQCRKDALSFVYKGVYNATGNNAVAIMDGLKLKFTQGIATTGTGAVGDIPTANIVTAAATINASNELTELQKLELLYFGAVYEPLEKEVIIAVAPMHIVYVTQALDAQLSNNSQFVYRESGKLRLAFLPNSSIAPRTWLKDTISNC